MLKLQELISQRNLGLLTAADFWAKVLELAMDELTETEIHGG